jgi:hypothetical protein
MKTYCSEKESYFFARGDLYIFNDKKAAVALHTPVLYVPTATINSAIKNHRINPKGVNDAAILQEFFEELKKGVISTGQLNGRFAALGLGKTSGRILYTGEIKRFDERSQDDLTRLLTNLT